MAKNQLFCKKCIWAKLPRGNAKIKAGQCYKIAHNDIMPMNIMPLTKACSLFEEKKPAKRWWKKSQK